MDVATNSFTVAEYVAQMSRNEIRVNREYQRSPRVWPTAARSYLIDTMLLGFPIPKLTLYQRTDLRTRTTIKEIVDGQQRSQAIFDFVNEQFRLGSNTSYNGRTFGQLDEEEQHRLLAYQLSVDVLVSATDDQIRQLFRRINSFTTPLNRQEVRNALFQGPFKWFIVGLTGRFAQSLKEIGAFREQQLSRMADAEVFSELIMALESGIQTTSQPKINLFYRERDQDFADGERLLRLYDQVFADLMRWKAIHGSDVVRPQNFYSLFLAVAHARDPIPALQGTVERTAPYALEDGVVLANLTAMQEGMQSPAENDWLKEFIDAQASGTNTGANRRTRFKWFSRALEPPAMP